MVVHRAATRRLRKRYFIMRWTMSGRAAEPSYNCARQNCVALSCLRGLNRRLHSRDYFRQGQAVGRVGSSVNRRRNPRNSPPQLVNICDQGQDGEPRSDRPQASRLRAGSCRKRRAPRRPSTACRRCCASRRKVRRMSDVTSFAELHRIAQRPLIDNLDALWRDERQLFIDV